MPVLMPTKDDLQRMTPMQRQRARRALLRIMAETDDYIAAEAARVAARQFDGAKIIDQARALERVTPRDRPEVIAERRRIALEATR